VKQRHPPPAAGSEFAILPPQSASGNWMKVLQRKNTARRHDRHLGAMLWDLFGRGGAKAAER
jgi:hypothetical protein